MKNRTKKQGYLSLKQRSNGRLRLGRSGVSQLDKSWYTRPEYLTVALSAAQVFGLPRVLEHLTSNPVGRWAPVAGLLFLGWLLVLRAWVRMYKAQFRLVAAADDIVNSRLSRERRRVVSFCIALGVATSIATVALVSSVSAPTQADILIARFGRDIGLDTLAPDRYSIREYIYQGLQHMANRELGECPAPTSAMLDERFAISTGEEFARVLGKKLHGKIAIWGWYNEQDSNVALTINVVVLDSLAKYIPTPSGIKVYPAELLRRFTLQQALGDSIATTVLILLAAEASSRRRYECGLNYLAQIEQRRLPIPFRDSTIFLRLRGDLNLMTGRFDAAIDDYLSVLTLSPHLRSVERNVSSAFLAQGLKDSARYHLMQAERFSDSGVSSQIGANSQPSPINSVATKETDEIAKSSRWKLRTREQANATDSRSLTDVSESMLSTDYKALCHLILKNIARLATPIVYPMLERNIYNTPAGVRLSGWNRYWYVEDGIEHGPLNVFGDSVTIWTDSSRRCFVYAMEKNGRVSYFRYELQSGVTLTITLNDYLGQFRREESRSH